MLRPQRRRKLAIGEVDAMAIVPEGFVKSCAFLCQETMNDEGEIVRVPKATGFFVRTPSVAYPEVPFDYFVTARHCLQEARSSRKPLYIRMATEAGIHEYEPSLDDWVEHDRADTAAIMMLPPSLPNGVTKRELQQSSLSLDAFVPADYVWKGTPPLMSYQEIRLVVGMEIFFTGLFTESYGGVSTNLPIARFGHIARMPSKIRYRSGGVTFDLIAYLVEATSFGGFSGSPVFFLHPTDLVDEDAPDRVASTAVISGFLGLVTGHFPAQAETREDDDPVLTSSGIAVVTPAEAIRELLFREDVVEQRDRLAKATVDRMVERIVLDSSQTDDEDTFTKDDFTRSLEKVSRKQPSQSDEASSGS